MIQYTTPTITLNVDAELNGDIYVTLKQGLTEITKQVEGTISEGSTVILLPLTQEETAQFLERSEVQIQVNCVNGSQRIATNIASVRSLANLLDEVIE